MRALDEAEHLFTSEGKKLVTHEAYSYWINSVAAPKNHFGHSGTILKLIVV